MEVMEECTTSPCPSPKPGGVGLGLATATPSTATTTAAPAFSADIAIAAAATAAGPQSVAAVVHRARYSSLRTGVLRLTPDSMKCKLYCRGVSCKYCTDYAWAPDQMALRGLYSAWVTPDILAMARPTSVTVEKHDLIKQFKENGIVAVFNLQHPNEHAFCGPPLHSSGFSYDPELFMKHNIFHYNFAMPDFEACAVEVVLDIVKVMAFALNDGKIAVHCHAGLGRTGAMIACYLVLSTGASAQEALDTVRRARPNSVQSLVQVSVIERVEEVMERNARVLPMNAGYALSSYFTWQNAFLPNEEARKFPHVPKLVFEICRRLLEYVFLPSGVRFEHRHDEHRRPKRLLRSSTDSSSTSPVSSSTNPPHQVHSCTFGELRVRWRNVFTQRGKAQNRYVANVLARLSGCPFEKDPKLIQHFRGVAVRDMEAELDALDMAQLLQLLHSYMLLPKKPLSGRKNIVGYMEAYSPEHQPNPGAEGEQDGPPRVVHKVWHCLIFFLCNVLSYLTIENYDIVTDLITFWLLGDVVRDVKLAVHAHMRDLYARNLRQQEEEVKQYRASLSSASTDQLSVPLP